MNISRAGVDIAKSVFQVHAVDRHGRPLWRAALKRANWVEELSQRLASGAEIGMEACASAHHWGRKLQALGFRVRLIGAQFVKPYVKSNKNDRVDAEAICEATRSVVWPGSTASSPRRGLGSCAVPCQIGLKMPRTG